MKALTTEFGMPEAAARGASVVRLSEEHAQFALTGAAERLVPGDRLLVVPSHGCTTFNLHDRLYGVRRAGHDGRRVECEWPISARGAFQ